MRVVDYECFVVSHELDPRTGPSIAYSSAHSYVVVRITGSLGHMGWGETYRAPGVLATVEETLRSVSGKEDSLRSLLREVRWVAGGLVGGGFANSAVAIALEDLRAKELGVPISELVGGPTRRRVRMYAASGGYVEGLPPEETWPQEYDRVRKAGFTAMKLRVGGYPIEHEAPLLEQLRVGAPHDFDLLADGNAAYTFKESVRMGKVMEKLGFLWFEEPMEQRSGYVGYGRLRDLLEIPLAGGEALMTRIRARQLFEAQSVDIVQPDPVIAGGVTEVLAIAELAALYGIVTVPHTSNSAIGIAAALQVIACLPDYTRSPSTLQPLLEYGVDDSPWRRDLLTSDFEISDGWVTIPTGPGLGVEIAEDYLRSVAAERRSGPGHGGA